MLAIHCGVVMPSQPQPRPSYRSTALPRIAVWLATAFGSLVSRVTGRVTLVVVAYMRACCARLHVAVVSCVFVSCICCISSLRFYMD